MSLEKSKFFAGARGLETNVFHGSMALGAGGEGAFARYGAIMRNQLAAEPPRNIGKRRLQQPKKATAAATKMPIGLDELTKKIAVGARNPPATSANGIKRVAKRAQATTTTNTTTAAAASAATKVNAMASNQRNRRHNRNEAIGTKCNSSNTPANRDSCSRRRIEAAMPTKWLLLPQSNFRQSSESSLDTMHNAKTATSNQQMQQLCVKTSWPNLNTKTSSKHQQQQLLVSKQSRVFLVPSQRILLADELKQAQLSQLQPKRKRSLRQQQQQQQRQQQQQQQASKTLLLQTDGVKQMASVDNSEISALSTNCTNISNGTTIGISGSSSGSGNWSKSQSYDTPLVVAGINKSLKLTSTVIQIMPDATPAATVAAKRQTKTQQQQAQPQPQQLLPKRLPVKQQSKQMKETHLQHQQHQQQQQQAQKTKATTKVATAAAAAVMSKIIRVDQHKVPKTVEDGIDISYQYFVNTSATRGRKPPIVRYLYRPMVRRLNPATAATTGRRSNKKAQSTQSTTTDEEEEQEQEQQQQLKQQSPANSNSDVKFDSETETEMEMETPNPPPIVVNAKYLPFVKQLKNHPMPPMQQRSKRTDVAQWQRLQQQLQQQQQHQQLQLQHQQQQQPQQMQVLQDQQQLIQRQQQLIEMQRQQLLLAEEHKQQLIPRPVLIDYQPTVTRLTAVGGASICFHAPIRVSAGAANAATATVAAEATESPRIAAVTYEDVETGIQLGNSDSNNNSCCQKQSNSDNSNSNSKRVCDLAASKKKLKCKSHPSKKKSRT
ncbi:GH12719 [Drosophila grimshawi]|uniref:GH12719 n=1 Tax=Drosophila grimshawi TaxID=7222 RepID=B4JKR1_DROGR|nr:GH12719 [Drosophila grimshawi]